MTYLKRRLTKAIIVVAMSFTFGVIGRAHADVPSLYLVQNSGWMEPFFFDSKSEFKPLLSALISASRGDGEVILASFNQDGQLPGHHSPEVAYRGAYDQSRIGAGLAAIGLPTRPDGKLADADFNGALVRGVGEVLGGHTGIVWLITNNKNSPNNSQQVTENTRAFAKRLSESQALPYVISYPLRMGVKGQHYGEKGLIIYGIAYGDEAAQALRAIVRSEPMGRLFKDPPMQLKPLEHAPLIFTPKTVNTPGITAQMMPGGGLELDGVQPDGGAVIEIQGTLTSEYYPYVIDTAGVDLQWAKLETANGTAGLSASIEPGSLHRLAPQDVLENVTLKMTTPTVARPDGLAGLMQNDVTLDGELSIELHDMRMTLQDSFVTRVTEITALDQLPEVFFDYKRISVASTKVPVRFVVHYSSLPLILGLSLLLLLLAALIAVTVLLRRRREHAVNLGGMTRRVALRPFESKKFSLPDGREAFVRGSIFGPPGLDIIDPSKRG
jgi:hypothetical protein